MISSDLLRRLRAYATDEELPPASRWLLRTSLDDVARADDVRAWRVLQACRDLARGTGSVPALEHALRACIPFTITKEHSR